ncbi:MAG: hypothetical protein VX768_03345 [Planctomycetota bacterium]|nr:hypothetical protein [Planctomycetota bacterium]
MNFRFTLVALILSSPFLFYSSSAVSGTPEKNVFVGKPPVLEVTAVRKGETVTISGNVKDEQWSTVTVTVYGATAFPITFTLDAADGEFKFDLKVALEKSEITIVAKDQERLTDSVVLDIAP